MNAPGEPDRTAGPDEPERTPRPKAAATPIGTSPRMRDQPSLTSSSGRSWLLLGGLLALIAIGVMIPMLPLEPAGVALFGICVVVALYAAMVVTRLNVLPGRLMLGLLATFMILIAVVGLVCVGVVAIRQGDVVF